MKTTDEKVIIKQAFNKSKKEVWAAITNHKQMVKWYFENIPDFKPEVGFNVQFNVSTGERNFLHIWKVTEVIPENKIVYNWKYRDYNGSADVSFELGNIDEETILKVKVNVLEDFDDNIPEFTRDSCLGGWKYFIQGRLKEYLGNN